MKVADSAPASTMPVSTGRVRALIGMVHMPKNAIAQQALAITYHRLRVRVRSPTGAHTNLKAAGANAMPTMVAAALTGRPARVASQPSITAGTPTMRPYGKYRIPNRAGWVTTDSGFGIRTAIQDFDLGFRLATVRRAPRAAREHAPRQRKG